MKKTCSQYLLLGMAALAIAALPIQAADKAEGQAKTEGTKEAHKAVPFHGKLAAKTDSSIKVGEHTFQVTSDTKIMKNGKPATLADGEIGKEVAGQYQMVDGKAVAKMIRFGEKAENKEGGNANHSK
jgi:hypothetical protein